MFCAGVKDTAKKSLPVSLIPVENFVAVSRTPLKNGKRDFTLFSGVKDTAENFLAVSMTPLEIL